ncbi:phage tail assembly protein [Xenorhabdus budapestensis]|uniref:Phage tail protein n=1 Tax=Xenorhabdus budapestensis TaxID=290110 RepID=A0A2D0IN85_XENBU|nr:phage tail assembly protein [Xenorhabdus budapestensis]PHM23265.1 phage tail protein [Xenorhabdus budapestensis]
MTEQITLPQTEQTTVTLEEPIARGATTITDIIIRKPTSGALRGVRLQALMEMDVDSMMLVLPRVTASVLTKNDLLLMAPGDLINLSVEVVNFLLPKSVKSDFQTA